MIDTREAIDRLTILTAEHLNSLPPAEQRDRMEAFSSVVAQVTAPANAPDRSGSISGRTILIRKPIYLRQSESDALAAEEETLP